MRSCTAIPTLGVLMSGIDHVRISVMLQAPATRTPTPQTIINPWTWQDGLGFVQGRVAGQVLYCAGQASVDENGALVHPGDMVGQMTQCLDNLDTLLAAAGASLAHVVRLNAYVVGVPAYFAALADFKARLDRAGCRPTATLLGVAGLFHPDAVIELEATAVL